MSSSSDLALLCDAEGVIASVFLDGMHAARTGARFAELAVPECVEKVEAFLRTLAANRSAFGWEVNLLTGDGVRGVQLAGSASDSNLLVVAGRSSADLLRVYEELQRRTDPALDAFRAALPRRSESAYTAPIDYHGDLYDELSHVNNELANSQRDLARRTADLERANSGKQDALNEILRLKEHLEDRVRERTREYEEANRELEAFSYSVSHDLRAPLRHISGFADLLIRDAEKNANLTEAQRRYLDLIATSTREAGILIDDLLAFARAGRAEMHLDITDVNELVRSIIDEFAKETAARGVEWIVEPLPSVHADPSMLRLVWRNLISNAVKYTSRIASPRVTIAAARSAAEHTFSVADNGAGFDMAYVDKLFGVFQRLHRAEEFPGTGIGLANVRRIIRRHGGRTWAEGAVGRGAIFYFTLPVLAGRTNECRS